MLHPRIHSALRFISLPLLIFILNSCFFEQPLYTESDLIWVPELEGEWLSQPEADQELKLERRPDKSYISAKKNQQTEFELLRFLMLQGQLFVDIHPYYHNEPFPAHMIAKVVHTDSTFTFMLVDTEALIKVVEQDGGRIKYRKETDSSSDYNTGTSYVVTEPTASLQKIIARYKNDNRIYIDNGKPLFMYKKMK